MDDFEKKLKESKRTNCSRLTNSDEIYTRTLNKRKESFGETFKKVFTSRLVLHYIFIVLLLSLITISSISLLKKDNNNENNNPNIKLNGDDYHKVVIDHKNFVQLTNINEIKNLITNSQTSDLDFTEKDDGLSLESSQTTGEKDIIEHEYLTNTQVENVDEADIVKVNGDYIYYVPAKGYLSNGSYTFGKNVVIILKKSNDTIYTVKMISFDYNKELIASNDEAQVYDIKTSAPIDLFYTDKYLVVRVNTTIYS